MSSTGSAAEADRPGRFEVVIDSPSMPLERSADSVESDANGTEPLLSRLQALEDNVCRVVRGKREVVRMALIALAARGHVLIEDVPGVGKTTLARSLARSLNLEFQRIQFTSDLLPSDVVGVSVYRQSEERFEFVPGPIFANIVLGDEINRATPKTQSALLEAMAENSVTLDRTSHGLPQPFLVLATQNPLEHQGTFPLPESQLDRFLLSLEIGYPDRGDERDLLLSGGVDDVLDSLQPVLGAADLIELQSAVGTIHVEPKLADYMVEIAEATRGAAQLSLGVSTRGLQGLYRVTQAAALFDGRDYAVPDDVRRLAPAVLSHRITFRRPTDSATARATVERLVNGVPVPV